MNTKVIKSYFDVLVGAGYSFARISFGITLNELTVINPTQSKDNIVRLLEDSDIGGILYSDNIAFCKLFHDFFVNEIDFEVNMESDGFQRPYSVQGIKISDDNYRVVFITPGGTALLITKYWSLARWGAHSSSKWLRLLPRS